MLSWLAAVPIVATVLDGAPPPDVQPVPPPILAPAH